MSLSTKAPQEATWIYDGMALYRKVKPEATYREWMMKVVREAMSEPIENNATDVHIANDQYWKLSTKNDTRIARAEGEVSRRVHLRGFDQKMLKGNEWHEFFHNGDNKENLIDLFCRFMKTDDGRKQLRIPLVINCKNETWRITRGNIEIFAECNHEEADTRMVFHAVLQTNSVVIEASDSDVFFLLAYAMNEKQIETSLWYQKIEENQFVDIRKICDHLGSYTCSVLPQLHAITGCDQTSYKHKVGKLKVFNKILKNPSLLTLIENLGKDSTINDDVMKNVFLFVQTVLYGGNKKETYVETRVRLYKNLKNKSSIDLPADPDSMTQEIKRCHLQAYIWIRCFHGVIRMLDSEDFGWRALADDTIEPVWFTGHQFPPSLRKATKSQKSKSQSKSPTKALHINDSYEHSNQESDVEPLAKRRKRRKQAPLHMKTSATIFSEYDADTEATETVNESEIESNTDDDM